MELASNFYTKDFPASPLRKTHSSLKRVKITEVLPQLQVRSIQAVLGRHHKGPLEAIQPTQNSLKYSSIGFQLQSSSEKI